ncbi:MAG: glycosyl hydrolase family 28 protein [Bacilli bacterium]|nr:glycosyl hydrolase family 28 protein [Bacilli bacterium]
MNKLKNNPNDYNKYQKRGFFRRLPFGLKATFIKYWFYGALYFFCYMGLGLYISNEDFLLLVTGLIGGVLFDIALYNIYILIADTREEASKWWIFKNKWFFSIFINIAALIGIFFLFHFIAAPITAAMMEAMPGQTIWLFHEPLTAAILLTALDTGVVWLKNLIIMWFRKILKRDEHGNVKKEDYIKVLNVTPVSVSVEVNNKSVYYSDKPFNILLDNEIILKKVSANVLTIFDLKPDTQYKLSINRQSIVFTTPKIYKAYKVYEGNDLQKVIDMADQYSLIMVNKGTYKIKSLVLKSNITLYLRKDVTLLASPNEDDYPIIEAFSNKKEEVYGNYKGEAMKMRQSIIHLDHLKNVTIVGEGTIDGQANTSTAWKKSKFKIAPPHLIFINHSTNITMVGINLKNSPQWAIHPFFSSNVNLLNLNITNEKDSVIADGITPQCSSDINIIGDYFSNLNNCVAIKAGKKEIADDYQVSSRDIVIRNCCMVNSKGAITLGSECSSGIHSVNASYCNFVSTDTGVLVKTDRHSGNKTIIKDISVNNINMDGVLTPIVMNMIYTMDASKLNKKFMPIDKDTPYFENFSFKDINAKNFEYAAGYFYGLPEKYIYEIKITDSTFTPKEECRTGTPIMMDDASKCSKKGFIAKNVRSMTLKNVKLNNIAGKRFDIENVSEISDNP